MYLYYPLVIMLNLTIYTPRVMSSLRDKEIVFPPYGADQLADILSERAHLSFKEDTIESDVIPLCSAMAAKEEGDARYA